MQSKGIGQDKSAEQGGFVVRKAVENGTWSSYPEESYARIIDSFITQGDLKPGARVLEIGCATGEFSMRLMVRGLEVTAVDIAPELVEIARTRNGVNAQLGDAEDMAFEDGTFEAILSVDMLHHFVDQSHVVRECLRVLKPGGVLFVSDINGYNPHSFLAQAFCSPVRYSYLNRNESVTYAHMLRNLARKNGCGHAAEYVFVRRSQRTTQPGWKYKLYGFVFAQIDGTVRCLLGVALFNIAHLLTRILPQLAKGNILFFSFRKSAAHE